MGEICVLQRKNLPWKEFFKWNDRTKLLNACKKRIFLWAVMLLTILILIKAEFRGADGGLEALLPQKMIMLLTQISWFNPSDHLYNGHLW